MPHYVKLAYMSFILGFQFGAPMAMRAASLFSSLPRATTRPLPSLLHAHPTVSPPSPHSSLHHRHGRALPSLPFSSPTPTLFSSSQHFFECSISSSSPLLCRAMGGVATEAAGKSGADDDQETSPPDYSSNWNIKMLYDSECPLCMREVNMLRERNKRYGAIEFVDICADNYDAEDNNGIDFETAMGRIHAIRRNGKVLTNIEAFRALYEEVGLGWVYAITNHQPWASLADAVYEFWAKYRLPVTGRPPLAVVLEQRRQRKTEAETCSIKDQRCRTE